MSEEKTKKQSGLEKAVSWSQIIQAVGVFGGIVFGCITLCNNKNQLVISNRQLKTSIEQNTQQIIYSVIERNLEVVDEIKNLKESVSNLENNPIPNFYSISTDFKGLFKDSDSTIDSKKLGDNENKRRYKYVLDLGNLLEPIALLYMNLTDTTATNKYSPVKQVLEQLYKEEIKDYYEKFIQSSKWKYCPYVNIKKLGNNWENR